MLINVGELVRREMLADECRRMTNSFANVACITARPGEFVYHTQMQSSRGRVFY